MIELPELIPNPDDLLALEPEELAGRMIAIIRTRSDRGQFHPGNMRSEPWNSPFDTRAQYPRGRQKEVDLAIAEAFAWLEAQGLIVPAEGMNGTNGWRHLSRRASRLTNDADFTNFRNSRRLKREDLHPRMASPVWSSFLRGEYDAAAFQAMKAVEIAVRDAGSFGADQLGTKLMRAAFNPDTGPLTDKESEFAERQGRMELFSGAIASYKNPHSHRDVNLSDPSEALETIFLANHLLRVVDARAAARPEGS